MTSQSSNLLDNYNRYMYLKILVDSNNDDLKSRYYHAVNSHKLKVYNKPKNIDAGFDLFTPQEQLMTNTNVNKLDYQIICSAKMIEKKQSNDNNNNDYDYSCSNTGYYMYSRSSISRNNIRLANNVGIIDSGYRGHLIGMFDVIYIDELIVNKFDRHVQICAPGLVPIYVELVSSLEQLGEETERKDGVFVSTGI